MALAERTAEVMWEGTLASGSGTLRPGGGAFEALPVDWKGRSEDAEGTTSPEELLAAAHASCYAMSLAVVLADRGHRPGVLDVAARCALDEIEGGYAITSLHLKVTVSEIEGLTADELDTIAHDADQGCPISRALRDNVEIEIETTLA